MADRPDPGDEPERPEEGGVGPAPLPPEVARYGEWRPAGDAAGGGRRWPRRAARPAAPRRAQPQPRTPEPGLRERLAMLPWSLRATSATAIGGAIALTYTAPAATDASGPAALGLWAATAGIGAVTGGGAGLALRNALLGPAEASRRGLAAGVWERHTRRVPSGIVIDAPGQTRWQFATVSADIERRLHHLPAPERAVLLEEVHTVAVTASRLLRDAEQLGQARLRLFPGARFGRLDLTADDSEVPGAGAAFRRLLDDAERQLLDLTTALGERAPATATALAPEESARLHALVSLAELEADPATRGPEPAIVRAAERLRAEAAAERELGGT